jgi:hypothetical protein
MARSGIRGVDKFKRRLRAVADAADFEMAAANKEAALVLQRHVVPRIPVKTGLTRDAFADASAVGISRQHKGGWRFGLISKELKKRGYKAIWIEYGTKGYSKGSTRSYQALGELGPVKLGKNGKPLGRPRLGMVTRKRAITRGIPPRRAQPFFRPGIEAAMIEIRGLYKGALRRAVERRGQAIRPSSD